MFQEVDDVNVCVGVKNLDGEESTENCVCVRVETVSEVSKARLHISVDRKRFRLGTRVDCTYQWVLGGTGYSLQEEIK